MAGFPVIAVTSQAVVVKPLEKVKSFVTQKKRILCVDDDEYSCSLLVIILTSLDVDAVSVCDAAEGVKLARKEKFDLYILDGTLRLSSGERFSQKIRATDHTTPIIIFSGRSLQEDLEAALAAGANAYVLKPYIEELSQTVRQILFGRWDMFPVLPGY
jgi:DNA-binding response OmpR family regulator